MQRIIALKNGMVTMIHTDAGYYTPTGLPPGASGPSYVHLWYLKDHLGNNRVLANERGIALSTHHYDPYGAEISISTSNPSNPFLPGMADSPYKYGGKEWNAATSTYDFEARYLSPSFHRFTTMDPLCEKYYSISPYAYCAGDPVNLVDPEGREMGDKETLWYCLKHPYTALRIGKVKNGSTNISTNSVRFATRGEILHGSKPREQEERGSEAGAFRHALWQAAICSNFGGRKAIEVGYAHEDNVSSFDYTKMKYESISEADMAVDLFNNQVGRTFSSEGMDMKQLALKLLDVFESLGLYTAKQVGEGEWIVERSVLDEERAKQLRDIFMQLDKNGFYEAEH